MPDALIIRHDDRLLGGEHRLDATGSARRSDPEAVFADGGAELILEGGEFSGDGVEATDEEADFSFLATGAEGAEEIEEVHEILGSGV